MCRGLRRKQARAERFQKAGLAVTSSVTPDVVAYPLRRYPTGIQVPDEVMNEIRIERDEFHGDWNYVIRPRTVAQ
jgi:hypothetical protein